jgi:hypothetical protein
MKKRLVIETIMNYETAKLDGKTSSGHMTSAVNIKQKKLASEAHFLISHKNHRYSLRLDNFVYVFCLNYFYKIKV